MKKFALFLLLMLPVWAEALPQPDHVVVVIEENKSFTQIIGNKNAPYINKLAKRGVLFTQSYGVTHPSQPNYLALFTGTTRGISSNVCPLDLGGDNLVAALQAMGLEFAIYSESLPHAGADDCIYGGYRRKHNPVADWQELAAYNLPFTAFPQDYTQLPTVSFVVPDQRHDMHDGSIAQGDAWLKQNLAGYADWALQHNSLLIVTWDEDNGSANNRVATIVVGQMVKPGKSAQHINHYGVLRTIEEMYGLPYLNESAKARPISGIWR